jgi:hypothetical protein
MFHANPSPYEELMSFSMRALRASAAAVVLAAGLAGCGDDDPTDPPATPPAPTGLAAAAGETSVQVTWNTVSGATSYVLERADPSAPGTFGAIGGSIPTNSYTDDGVTPGTAYSYRVAAVNGNGTSSFSSPVNVSIAGARVATLEGNITTDRTLSADTLYTLKGYVKFGGGSTLTIPAGTTIVGDPATPGSSLWILRGSSIDAQGTADAPIVFTSGKPVDSRAPGDWGGLIIVGNGIINRTPPVLTEGPQGITEDYSGGTDNADNSGILRYVRIEFAGYDVSGTGQELNSLSMYAVGSGTTLEYVQSLAGLDDSFEWWGGAVDGRYLVSYESGDDHFDWSEGYRGQNQFLIAFQSARLDPAPGAGIPATDPQGFEADGCNGAGCALGFATQPFSVPVFANYTLVGPGTATTPTSGGDVGMVLRRGTGGYLTNGIVARWQSQGLSVRDPETNTLMTSDSLNISNLLLAENALTYDDDAGTNFGKAAAFAASNHVVAGGTAASLFTSLTPASLDWTPPAGSAASTGAGTVVIPPEYTDGFFGGTLTNTTYFGAADPAGPKWWQGWTSYDTD